MTGAIRNTTSAIEADPTNEGLNPIGVVLVAIIDAVIAGGAQLGIIDLVDAIMSLAGVLLNEGLIGEEIRAVLALLEGLLSVGTPETPVDPRPTPVK